MKPRSLDGRVKATPPQLARRYGVDVHKIIRWIEAGELRAVNLATTTSGRPRWAIDEADILVFEQRRQAQPQVPIPRRRRRLPAGMIEYF
ncbi:MAG: helix-turn-helix domain-containing protein [Thermoguttaceae bacterium]|jgi:transposase